MAIAGAVFIGVLGIILGAYALFVVRPERVLLRRLQPATGLTRSDVGSGHGLVSAGAGHTTPFLMPLKRFLEQAHVPITVPMFLVITGGAMVGAYVLVLVATKLVWVAIMAGLGAGAVLPLYTQHARSRRLLRFEEQLPDAVDLIARALRAGHGLTTGLEMVALELEDPISTEFRVLYDEQNFGLTLQQAMRNFAERVPLLDARFFVTAVLTQREAGGNLAEVLDNLARVIRERFRVKRQIRVISTHGRLTGWVLVLLPPTLALGMFLISPNHLQTLVRDPIGVRMIIAAVVLQITGTLIIRRIVNVEY
ncbi:MAG TPA: type II secretion system F family protein [Vicinamibacterales bacterium]|jgi:tight adherence protein B|nr:type II secretion system F family protein [Acidobacteriota bacterium]HQX83250.1 type II secretion system F family protein [Vicinamibacterales bacterium]